MWIVDIYGKGLDLSTGLTLQWVQKEPKSEEYGVVLCRSYNNSDIVNSLHSNPVYVGTEAECRDFIADLVERLNAPAKIELTISPETERSMGYYAALVRGDA
jgi:hypothetical protein